MLRCAGRRDVAGANHRPADRPGIVSFELENPVEKLGWFSSSAAVFALRSFCRRIIQVPREATDAEREELRKAALKSELRSHFRRLVP